MTDPILTETPYGKVKAMAEWALANGMYHRQGLTSSEALKLRTIFYNFRNSQRLKNDNKFDSIVVNITPDGLLFRRKP